MLRHVPRARGVLRAGDLSCQGLYSLQVEHGQTVYENGHTYSLQIEHGQAAIGTKQLNQIV